MVIKVSDSLLFTSPSDAQKTVTQSPSSSVEAVAREVLGKPLNTHLISSSPKPESLKETQIKEIQSIEPSKEDLNDFKKMISNIGVEFDPEEVKALVQLKKYYSSHNESELPVKISSGSIPGIKRNIFISSGVLYYHFNKAKNSDTKHKGGFGSVSDAFDLMTGKKYAIKSMKSSDNTDIADQMHEFQIQAMLSNKSDHIVPATSFIKTKGKNGDKSYVFMESMREDLSNRIYKHYDEMTFEEKHQLAKETTAALKDIHAQGIIHRDIKPSNVLISTDGHAKVSDFGGSCDCNEKDRLEYVTGTPRYLSPQVAESSLGEIRKASQADDVWAHGIMLYELYNGFLPFFLNSMMDGRTLKFELARLQQSSVDKLEFSSEVPGEVQDLIRKCLTVDESKRPTIDQIDTMMNSFELKQHKGLFEKLLLLIMSLLAFLMSKIRH